MPDEIHDWLDGSRDAIDAALTDVCDLDLRAMRPQVRDAIRYALLGEGKRLRGLLVLAAYRAAGGGGDAARLAAAVEVVHAYSLVHDDLPCMDDDDLRRGRLTVHRAFGEVTAVTAGVAMVPLAAWVAYEAAVALGTTTAVAGTIVRELMVASGAGGMIGGQWLDLQAEGQELTLEALERVHTKKTGMLLTASVRLGAMAAGAPEPALEAFTAFGERLGLAFQIADDVLDVTATSDQLGKTAGKDVAVRKSTYPRLLGVEGAMARARELQRQACDELRARERLTPALEYLAAYVVERKS